MTDQQPHTPNISDFREDFVTACAQSYWLSADRARDYFNRELAAIEAAAEQRGAIKALRAVMEMHKPFDWSFSAGDQVYTITSCAECARLGADEEDAIYPCPTVQAITDAMEDDDD